MCNNTWEFLGDCPITTEGFAVCIVKDKILISGGLADTDTPVNDFVSYDPEHAAWSRLLPVPISCSDHTLFYFEKKVFSVGGWTTTPDQHIILKDVFSFTLETGWIKEDWEVPNTQAFQQFVFTGKLLVVIGGGSLKASQRLLPVDEEKKNPMHGKLTWFDFAAKTWNQRPHVGVAGSFWDHKSTVAFLPRLR